jgi:hypothetical protein
LVEWDQVVEANGHKGRRNVGGHSARAGGASGQMTAGDTPWLFMQHRAISTEPFAMKDPSSGFGRGRW